MVQCAKLLKPQDRHVGTYRHSLERISVFDANALLSLLRRQLPRRGSQVSCRQHGAIKKQ